MQSARPSETMTSLLFPSHTDCVLVGDSGGQVTVYQLHNLQRETNQVKLREKRPHSTQMLKGPAEKLQFSQLEMLRFNLYEPFSDHFEFKLEH